MAKDLISLFKRNRRALIILICVVMLSGSYSFLKDRLLEVKADSEGSFLSSSMPDLMIFEQNSLDAISSPANPDPEVAWRIGVVVTAYSSTPWQTDDTPFITASGSKVRDGIIANNYLAFGTKVRIPELYGDKIFVVEDRMSWKKGDYHFDIWFPDYSQALNFGAKRTYIEILED